MQAVYAWLELAVCTCFPQHDANCFTDRHAIDHVGKAVLDIRCWVFKMSQAWQLPR